MLETLVYEENPIQKEIPKITKLQGLKIGSGEGI